MENYFHALLSNGASGKDENAARTCFRHFDKDEDQGLSLAEFGDLAKALFCDATGKPYSLQARLLADMFYIFDANRDGRIDWQEFQVTWYKWIKTILYPVSALIVVDVQNDFITGTIPVEGGAAVVPVINHMLDTIPFNVVCYSLDWHPDNHVSFIENVRKRKLHYSCKIPVDEIKTFDQVVFEGPPKVEQKLWPKHCVQESWGSHLHPDLKVASKAVYVYKGIHPEIDSYSAFYDNQRMSETKLNLELQSRNVTDVFLCGLAYDVCVSYTALHALELGYRTTVVDDGSRGVGDDDIKRMQSRLLAKNGVIITSDAVDAMVKGYDRRPELGLLAAMNICSPKTGSDSNSLGGVLHS